MRPYRAVLCTIFSEQFKMIRDREALSQEDMSEVLDISTRSYVELEHGRSLCNTGTFVRLLVFIGPDGTLQLVEELKKGLEDYQDGIYLPSTRVVRGRRRGKLVGR